jgi:DNA-binding sugar fermentation-stimulating protein
MTSNALSILTEGIFVEECKNRFLCKVDLPELGEVLCYVPSSARLTNMIELLGKLVCLGGVTASAGRARYSLLAKPQGGKYVLLNLNVVNDLIKEALEQEG